MGNDTCSIEISQDAAEPWPAQVSRGAIAQVGYVIRQQLGPRVVTGRLDRQVRQGLRGFKSGKDGGGGGHGSSPSPAAVALTQR